MNRLVRAVEADFTERKIGELDLFLEDDVVVSVVAGRVAVRSGL
jgi:hypothetical protein